jgi:hypothetical protein
MSAASSKIGASILNQSSKQIDSEQSNKQSLVDKKNNMSTPKIQKGTTPFYISGFQPVANNSLIKVPIPNKTLFSDNKEFQIRSCDSLKSAVRIKGTKFTNMFGNHSPKEEEMHHHQIPTSLDQLCSNVTNIQPQSYR